MNEDANTVPRQGVSGSVSVTFLIVVTKFLEVNLRRERIVLPQSLKASSIVVRNQGSRIMRWLVMLCLRPRSRQDERWCSAFSLSDQDSSLSGAVHTQGGSSLSFLRMPT